MDILSTSRLLLALLVSVLTWPSPVLANSNWRSYEYADFTGGLADGLDPTTLKLNEAQDLQNVTFGTSGGIEKRGGFTPINASAACGGTAFTGLTMYRQADG